MSDRAVGERVVELYTARLALSRFHPGDAAGMVALNAAADVYRLTGDPPFASVDEAERLIAGYDNYRRDGFGRLTMRLRADGSYVGWCGLSRSPATGEVDLGFRVLEDLRGRGYATEAARACLAHAFGALGLDRVLGRAVVDNAASHRVLERCGMRRVGLMEPSPAATGAARNPHDASPWVLFEITRDEHRARAG